jgi:hypothetical protein
MHEPQQNQNNRTGSEQAFSQFVGHVPPLRPNAGNLYHVKSDAWRLILPV